MNRSQRRFLLAQAKRLGDRLDKLKATQPDTPAVREALRYCENALALAYAEIEAP